MFLVISRTFKESIKSVFRNGWLSVATTSILIMCLYIISIFFVFTGTADNILEDIKNKANVSVYFKTDVEESTILEAKSQIEKFAEVKSVEYTSRDAALDNFKQNFASEPVVLESLKELGDNPLPASLVVKAGDTSKYQAIVDGIKIANFSDDVGSINYNKNKELITKLTDIIATIRKVGISLGSLLAAISLLITFNAIRIAIYTHKQEIEIMRLVGASNTFIRLPFVFEGIIYGVIASFVSMALILISLKFIAPYITSAIPAGTLVGFYADSFWMILGYQIFLGSFFGVIGGLMAMRKYLKV